MRGTTLFVRPCVDLVVALALSCFLFFFHSSVGSEDSPLGALQNCSLCICIFLMQFLRSNGG
jgi:hypothetical protein